MGHYQVIKQPDGKLAIFSEETGTWAHWDSSPEGVVDWFARRAEKLEREHAEKVVTAVASGHPEKIYYQFAKTFAEAQAESSYRGGEVLEGDVDRELLAELERPFDDADA